MVEVLEIALVIAMFFAAGIILFEKIFDGEDDK